MTTVLALDTSSNGCSVALSVGGDIFNHFELAPRGHMQKLLPMVDEVLVRAEVTVKQLDAIAFARGPGSFTGLRVATGVVQGLAFGADKPVIPVSTLAALARGFLRTHPEFDGEIGVAIDARMNEVYAARFKFVDGTPQLLGSEQVLPPAIAAEQLLLGVDAGVGSGWTLDPLNAISPKLVLVDVEPDALDVLFLAMQSGVQTLSAEQAIPVYLRDTVSWEKRKRIRKTNL